MTECFRCGVSGSSVRLFDAVGKEGLVKLCANCLKEEGIPMVQKPTTFQLKEAESSSSKGVYERLSRIAGVDPREHREKFSPGFRKKEEALKKQDTSLRELVDKNYKKNSSVDMKPRPDLVANFHWIIMRVRRMKKLTREQLAKLIGESTAAIEMAERGAMPEDGYRLARKLETTLGVRLIKDEVREAVLPKELDVTKSESKELTIGDLKMIKAYKETENIQDELEEDAELNDEFNVQLEDLKKEKKGFWGKFFGKKKKEEESDGGDVEILDDVLKEEEGK